MKNLLTFFSILLSLNSAVGQKDPSWDDHFVRIIKNDGADLKIKPNITSKTLTHLPFWAEVEISYIDSYISMNDTINEIYGQWLNARYQGVVGYLFDGFAVGVDTSVRKDKDIRIMIEGYLCAYPNFDTELYWYGVYRNNFTDSLIRVEIEIIKLPGFEGEYISFFLKTNRTEKQESTFLIGSSIPMKEKVVNTNYIVEDLYPYLYPGQRKHIFYQDATPSSNRHNGYELYATGSVIGIDHRYPIMENYSLQLTNKNLLTWKDTNRIVNQDISNSFAGFSPHNLPGVYWFGDLDDDLVPDLVFITVPGTTSSLLTLFLSGGTDVDELLRKADWWVYYNCY